MSETEPSWDLYGALLAVLREGSLSAAARSLGLTQPTVRRQIEQLEEALGVVLFTRSSNGLVPTDVARAALPHAESIAAAARALARAVTDEPGVVRGTVRLTASEIIGVEVLPPILADLRERFPALHIELVASNRTANLLRRDADVAVRMVEPTQAGLVRARAGRIEIGLFAHPRYLEKHGTPRTPSQLAEGHWLVGADRSPVLVRALAAHGVSLRARQFGLRSDSDVVQLAALRAGLGIGACQVPLSRAPPLVRVLPALSFTLDTWVVMHEDLRSSARVRTVFDTLVERLRLYAGAPPRPASRSRPRSVRARSS